MIHRCFCLFKVIVVHESLVCPEQFNCLLFFIKNPSGPTNSLVFQYFCLFEPFPTMTVWFWDPRRLQFAQAHQNWTIEDWKNVAWSDESRFLLRHWDGRVRIWHKEPESMDPFCLVSTVQAGGGDVMVWGIFSWHTLGPLVPIEHHLNATAYLSIIANLVIPL